MSDRTAWSHPLIAAGVGLILGIVSIRFSSLYTLGLVLGIVLAAICAVRPELVLLALLVFTSTIIGSRQIPSFSIGFGTLYITDLLIIFLFGLIVVRALVEPDFKIVRTPLDWPLLFFVGAWLVSGFAALWQGRMPFNQTLGEARTILSYLTFFCVTNLVRQKQQLVFLRQGLIALGLFVSLAMAAQYLLGLSRVFIAGRVESLARSEGVSSIDATRIIPPGQSIIVVAFMVLVVALILGTQKRGLVDVWRFLLCGLLGLAILLTFYRASWIAIGLTLMFMVLQVWRHNRQRLLELGLAAIFSVTLIFLVFQFVSNSQMSKLSLAFTQRLGTLFESETYQDPNRSLRWRDIEYSLAVPEFLSHPIMGLGPGAYYRPYIPGRDYEGNVNRGWVHNAHLWILLKAGLLGYIGMLWFSAIFLERGFKFWQRGPDAETRGMMLAFTVTYVGVLIVSVVEPYIVIEYWTPVIGIMMGMNEVSLKLAAQDKIAPAETGGARTNA